jgi:hypothetical protein
VGPSRRVSRSGGANGGTLGGSVVFRPGLILPLGFASLVVSASACEYPTFEYSECALEFSNSCGKGKKCALVEASTGKVACVAPGVRAAWEGCDDDTDCVAGTLCDPRYRVCKPLCSTDADCVHDVTVPEGSGSVTFQVKGECIEPELPNGTRAPLAVKHCTASCEPLSSAPCARSTSAKCFERSKGAFDCGTSGLKLHKDECKSPLDCAAGLLCVASKKTDANGNTTTGPALCRYWCDNEGKPCRTNDAEICTSLGIFYEKNGVELEYGACL